MGATPQPIMARVGELPQGWFQAADIERYRWIYEKLVPKGGQTAEVGSYYGRSICSVADIIKQKKLWVVCVDIWAPFKEDHEGANLPAFLEATERFGLHEDYLHPMHTSSLQAACDFSNAYFDFVFIDAAHDYNSVKADIEAWAPKIKPGGHIGGHDYWDFPGVLRAVNEAYGSRVMVGFDSSIWLVRV